MLRIFMGLGGPRAAFSDVPYFSVCIFIQLPTFWKFCHWVEMVIMAGKHFSAIIKVTRSVVTQERKCSGKTVETFNKLFSTN